MLALAAGAADAETSTARKVQRDAVRALARSGRSALNGRALYETHCASCHGRRGTGDGPDAALYDPPPRNLRDGFLARHSDPELVSRILDGRALPLALDPAALHARAADVEAIAAHIERLPAVNWRLTERGQEIYVDRCEICHGPYGRGATTVPRGVGTPRDLSDPAFQRSVDDDELRVVVEHGRRGMPAIPRHWTESDARALAAFVRLLSPGYERYSRYCAACHGDDGRGTGSFAEVSQPPTPVFDHAYFSHHDVEHVRAAVWHMLDEKKPTMPHFRSKLSAGEARAIVEHLKHGR
jgi:mono/diheme cytochrome c family protein